MMKQTPTQIATGQEFTADKFTENDAEGVVNLFLAVYGTQYPIRTYYNPAKIIAESRKKNICMVVARTDKGDIIGITTIFKSSPHNPKLYEMGIMLVLPDYRNSGVAHEITRYALNNYIYQLDLEGIFVEAVCNITATQKMGQKYELKETAIEVGLMPASAYDVEKSAHGRVSCIMGFKILCHDTHPQYLPEKYIQRAKEIMADVSPDAEFRASDDKPQKAAKTGASLKYFGFAQVLRVNVYSVGSDFRSYANRVEKRYEAKGAEVIQFFISLGESWAPYAIKCLNASGFYMAGIAPRWFGPDGILMIKNVKGEISELLIYTDKAKKMLTDINDERPEHI